MRILSIISLIFLLGACMPKPNKDISFVQLCDTQLGFGGYEHDQASFKTAVNQINQVNPDFVVICGDLVNDADSLSFADFKSIAEGFNMPYYAAPGNHDVGNEPTDSTLSIYRGTIGPDYYHIDFPGTRVLITNTQLWKQSLPVESKAHHDWFKSTLKDYASKGQLFVVGHYPLFLEDPNEEEAYFNLPLHIRHEILQLLTQYGVKGYLSGHTHRRVINDYEGIYLVGGESTSKNFDETPLGFRLWEIGEDSIHHQFVPITLDDANQ